nr:hypothetical protein CFP56_46874 [Quercus suber]
MITCSCNRFGIVCCSPIHQESTEKNIQREGCDWRNQTLLLGSLVTSVSESSDFRLCSMDRSFCLLCKWGKAASLTRPTGNWTLKKL